VHRLGGAGHVLAVRDGNEDAQLFEGHR